MQTKVTILILFVGLFFVFSSVYAHPGRTDSSGCHTCRTNCPSWGLSYEEYHCHRAKVLPQPEEPIKSYFGEDGTGYTEPAPEYKTPVSQPVIVPPVQPSQEKNQKIESMSESKQPSQAADISNVVKEKPQLNFWQKLFRWLGF